MIDQKAFEWLNENQLSYDIWDKKYRYNQESFDSWLDRVSGGNEKIKQLIYDKKFIFGGRILANRGLNKFGVKTTLSNCYVITPPEDNIESIFDAGKKLARTFSYGGGAGLDISNLRPKGASVNNAAKTTSGAVSFMDLYSHITGLIGQSGRRGALMLSIDCTHPDIVDFINLKTNLEVCTKANISIKMFDEFFQAIENNQDFYLYWNEKHNKLYQKQLNEQFNTLNYNELIFSNEYNSYIKKVNPKEILMLLAQRNWEMGEPGILYWDAISNYNILSNTDFQYAGVNPCAEEPLPAGGSCLLGSINLSEFVKHPFLEDAYFDYISFKHTVHQAINGLNEVLIEGLELHPLQEQRDSVRDWRQIGLGIMGLGDALIKLGITYGSDKAVEFTSYLSISLAKESIKQSAYLAKIDSCYPKCEKEKLCDSTFIKNLNLDEDLKNDINKYGLYNSQLLTCAPTGSISTMLQVSSGCEPNYAFKYTRKTQSLNNKDVYYEVNASILEDYLKIYPNTELPDYFISSNDLNYKDRIKMQEALQIGIDASISSTLNVKEQITIEDVYKIYYDGWKHHLKGCTIWRDNCYRAGVLSKDTPKEITQISAPKRPKKLSAHYYPVKVKGEQFIIMIGLLDSKPYEIFAFKDTTGFKCKDHEGVLIKKAKGHYAYESDCCSIDKIEVEAIEARTSIYLSMLLRHGVDIKQIIKTAKKVNPGITSFTSAIVRVLSKYTETEVTSETCPECGEKLIRESGCISCKSCGYSKCG